MNSPELRPDDVAHAMDELTALVAQASHTIASAARGPARSKADGSPVTDADEAAEAVILDGLLRILPGIPVVSEERVALHGAPKPGASFVLVDPLDGTREFIAGRDEYTVNVAVVSQGAPIIGLIAAPARGQLWRGIVGRGAERLRLTEDRAAHPQPIRTRRWPATGATALLSRSHPDAGTAAFVAGLSDTTSEICGSSLKFCRVAEGTADLYPRFGPTSEWDVAAGHALVAAAGGLVTNTDGRPLTYGKDGNHFRVAGFIAWGDPARARTT